MSPDRVRFGLGTAWPGKSGSEQETVPGLAKAWGRRDFLAPLAILLSGRRARLLGAIVIEKPVVEKGAVSRALSW